GELPVAASTHPARGLSGAARPALPERCEPFTKSAGEPRGRVHPKPWLSPAFGDVRGRGNLERPRCVSIRAMRIQALLPDPELVHLDYLAPDAESITLVVTTTRAAVACPDCTRITRRVHDCAPTG